MSTAVDIVADADLHDARDDLRLRLNEVINAFAGRTDVLLDTVWDAPEVTVPAWFDPARVMVTVQCDIALGDTHPDDVDPTTPSGRREHPVIAGLCAHEGGHAHGTRWIEAVSDTTPPAVVRAASLLEEPRIEARQIARRPGDQVYLRAASRHLHLTGRPADATVTEDRWRAAQAALLLLGRVDAGVLTDDDVAAVLPAVHAALGTPLLDTLCGLWREAIGLVDGDGAGLLDVAGRWVAALDIDPDVDPDATGTRLPSNGCSNPRPPAGSPDGGADATAAAPPSGDEGQPGGSDPLGDAVSDALGEASTDAERGCRPDPDTTAGEWTATAARAAERDAEQREQASADAEASRVFDRRGHGYGRHHSNPISGTRVPTGEEQAAANRLAAALRRARFRERSSRTVASAVPPGRLVGRDALQAAAQRALGQPVTATPFRQRIRRHTDQPPLTAGIAVDVSGSMGWAERVLSSVAWVVGQAVDRVGGRSATVAFGAAVTPIVAPGRPPSAVTEFRANDGFESFVEAVRALDGALGLATGTGARLLVVVSDGVLVGPGQLADGARLVNRLTRAGVGVLHLHLDASDTRPLSGATPVELGSSVQALEVIGEAAARALAAQ